VQAAWLASLLLAAAAAHPPAHKRPPREPPVVPAPSAPIVRIARGDTAKLEAAVKLAHPTEGPLWARVRVQHSAKDARILPFAEIADVDAAGSTARVAYAIQVPHDAGEEGGRLSAAIEIFEPGTPSPIGRETVEAAIEIAKDGPPATLEAIEADRRAFSEHQDAALAAHDKLRALQADLQVEKLAPPPSIEKVAAKDLPNLISFFRHRLAADVARERIRTLADAPDPKIREAAVLAIGALTKKPLGAAAKASVTEGERIGRSIEMAESALDDLRIDEAEGILNRLRHGGKLEKEELARCLLLFGGVSTARGRNAEATASFGRALCIDPTIRTPAAFRREPMARRFEEAKHDAKRCMRPIAIDPPTAKRTPEGARIHATFGPDPHQLAGGADLEIWGSGGALGKSQRVVIPEDGPREIEATLTETKDLETYAGQLLIKIYLRDVSGVAVASLGDPDPVAVSLGEGSGGGLDLPWWAWAVAGSVVVAGAVTAGAIVLGKHETKQGIGPISAEF
jgi:hypothetical protein